MNSLEIQELAEKNKQKKYAMIGGSLLFVIVCLLASVLLIGCPSYNVYTSKMQGRALLAHAQSAKEVAVATAKAKMESAAYEAQADTIIAHGVARSNEIIGNSLKQNEPYLYFKWLQTLQDMKGEGQVIYLPGGSFPNLELPITEANRLKEKTVVQKQE